MQNEAIGPSLPRLAFVAVFGGKADITIWPRRGS
jgi:hypothetical protein